MGAFGWRRDLPDKRDHRFTATLDFTSLPTAVDLRSNCPPVYDQGDLGSCTANGIAFAFDFARASQGQPFVSPSRLFIYYNERAIEHTITSDAGAEIRDGIKVVGALGVCPESEWPYDIAKFAVRAPQQCFDDALRDRAIAYRRIDNTNLTDLKSCLAEGNPFVFGFTVYDSFMDVGSDGIVPLPDIRRESVQGGHCVAAVGYDDARRHFIVRNSWGDSWADKGYCYMPYALLTDPELASDFWQIRLLTP